MCFEIIYQQSQMPGYSAEVIEALDNEGAVARFRAIHPRDRIIHTTPLRGVKSED